MWVIGVTLVLGILLGILYKMSETKYARINKVTTVTLFIMLFALGAQIGSKDELLSNMALLGSRAFIIALFSIIGSIIALWLVVRILGIEKIREDLHG